RRGLIARLAAPAAAAALGAPFAIATLGLVALGFARRLSFFRFGGAVDRLVGSLALFLQCRLVGGLLAGTALAAAATAPPPTAPPASTFVLAGLLGRRLVVW